MNKAKYAWCTAVPGIFMAGITLWAGYLQILGNYIPNKLYLLATFGIIIMLLMCIVFMGAFKRRWELLQITATVKDSFGETVLVEAEK